MWDYKQTGNMISVVRNLYEAQKGLDILENKITLAEKP